MIGCAAGIVIRYSENDGVATFRRAIPCAPGPATGRRSPIANPRLCRALLVIPFLSSDLSAIGWAQVELASLLNTDWPV